MSDLEITEPPEDEMLPLGQDFVTDESLTLLETFPPSLWKHVDYLYFSGIALTAQRIQSFLAYMSGQEVPIGVVRGYLQENLPRLEKEREIFLGECHHKMLLFQTKVGADMDILRYQRLALKAGMALEGLFERTLDGSQKVTPHDIKTLIGSVRELAGIDPVITLRSKSDRLKDIEDSNKKGAEVGVDAVLGEIVDYQRSKDDDSLNLEKFEENTKRIIDGNAD